MNRIKLAAMLLASLLLISCQAETNPAEATTYRVIENGTTMIEVQTIADYADFYIPEGMQTIYASINLEEDLIDAFNTARDDLGHFRKNVLLPAPADAYDYARILDIIRCEELSYIPLKARGISDFSAADGAFIVDFEYYLDGDTAGETMTRMNTEIEKVAETVMSGITADMDNFAKLKYIHDWLILNVETDDANSTDIYSSTLYGAMVNKKALCEGIAKSFSYLCNLAGIENCIVFGMAKLPHMWNMVKLDGNWYHVDVTYDHPDETITKLHPDFISYQYFCVSDTVIENDHTISYQAFTPPAANSTLANYFNREGYSIANEHSAAGVISKALADAVAAGRNFAAVKCASTDLYMKVSDSISAPGGFDEIGNEVAAQTGKEREYSVSDYYSKYRILTFFIEE